MFGNGIPIHRNDPFEAFTTLRASKRLLFVDRLNFHTGGLDPFVDAALFATFEALQGPDGGITTKGARFLFKWSECCVHSSNSENHLHRSLIAPICQTWVLSFVISDP